ncbi:MAG: DUF2089 family protein [Verrucomicrobiota bacterium]
MSGKRKSLSSRCLFCDGELEITQLRCGSCDTSIDSTLAIPSFFRLPNDLQLFVLVFLRCRGNIREVEKELGISYPTVCKRLDLVNELLGGGSALGEEEAGGDGGDGAGAEEVVPKVSDRKLILEQVERGEISARKAAELLRQIKK